MSGKQHTYNLTVQWTGNTGNGTADYRSYERSHSVLANDKADIACSSDPSFRGDRSKHNPEELLVASLSACHMLQYLHLCSEAGVVVTEYNDDATGIMQETGDGGGHFTEVILNPAVVVKEPSMVEKANKLHHQANKVCFIARSCNFPVYHKTTCKAETA